MSADQANLCCKKFTFSWDDARWS